MSLRDNKMTILRRLGQESEPVSLPDLMNKLGGEFKERSLRRWLNQLVAEGDVKKIGQKRGSVYISLEDPVQIQEQLEQIVMKGLKIADPYELSFFLLVHLSYLQAFADVNKRTARLSANIPLIKGNWVPLTFSDVSVEDYMSAMISIYETHDVGPLSDLYAHLCCL